MSDTTGEQLARVAAVVRGLLAEPTGDDDVPFNAVILSVSGDQDQSGFEDALRIDPIAPDEPTEKTAEKIRAALDSRAAQNRAKPRTICIKDLGVFSVTRQASPSGPPLRNKIALVTGAAGAIGYGVCRALLENGAFLAATDLPGEKFDRFVDDLKQIAPDRVLGVPLDVTDEGSTSAAFREVVLTWGGIDIVVINAGIAMVAHLKEMDVDAFRKLEKVNVEGTLLTLQESIRYLIPQGTGGDIVVMSTKNVPCPGAGFGAYSATKAACHQLGRIASLELAQYGVRVNMIAPDAVFSEGKYKSGLWSEVGPDRMKARGLDEKGLHEYYRSRNLLKARVTGRHVANAVLFFVTRQTPTTGATIPVDGGLPDATPR